MKAIKEANVDVGGGGGGMRKQLVDTTLMARKYHNMVLEGKVRAAVHMVMNMGSCDAYHPTDHDTKSG